MIPESRLGKPDLLRVACPSTRNNATTGYSGNATRNRNATATQQTSLKALAMLALARNNSATGTQQEPQTHQKTTQQTVSNDRDFVARESTLLRVAPVAFLGGATTQQTETLARTVVKFRLPGGCPHSWCTAIGTRTRAEIIEELRALHGAGVEVLL